MKTHTWTDATPVAKPQVVAIVSEPAKPKAVRKSERDELRQIVARQQAREAHRHPRHFVNQPLADLGELLLDQKGA